MRYHIRITLTALLAGANVASAAHKPFSIQDDVLASPQFEVLFPDEYILESDARLRLAKAQSQYNTATNTPAQPLKTPTAILQDDRSDLSQQVRLQDDQGAENENSESDEGDIATDSYHEMVLDGQRFLCGIPNVSTLEKDNASTSTPNPDEEAVELARATNRGLELLSDLEGKCLYYAAGWWSYSFCYMSEVRQFHARLPGNGVPVYPPAEDPDSTTYVLGRFQGNSDSGQSTAASTEVAALQTKGESWYLVQYLERGTICDLTRKPRKIEVQFHCHPQSPEHIAWIKEITTCSYVMMVYTPRLCNDVAFQPPRVEQPNSIKCREIIIPEHVPIWEAAKAAKKAQAKRELVEGTEEPFVIVGDIEVGAMKLVGKDGKRIEKDQFGFGEEKIRVVVKSEGGKVKVISKEALKEHKLTGEKFERMKKELDEAAEGKDWRLEEVVTSRGKGLRGVIDDPFDEEEEEEEKDHDEKGEAEARGKPNKDNAKKETKPKLQQQNKKMKKKKGNTKKQDEQKLEKGRMLQKQQKQKVSDETVPEAGSDETYKIDSKEAKEQKRENPGKPDTGEKKEEKEEKDEL